MESFWSYPFALSGNYESDEITRLAQTIAAELPWLLQI
jgi:hypothetical protein